VFAEPGVFVLDNEFLNRAKVFMTMRNDTSDSELGRIEKMVVGLGNPGQDYARTRHNLGFRALDNFLKALGIQKSFDGHGKARIQIIKIDGRSVLLVKPSTFMNLSGTAVQSLLTATGLGVTDLLVVHDEMDIPQGRAKMKVGGGAAGHKGVGDIIDRCGVDFSRIKIGIGRPEEDDDESGIDWVLGEPGAAEEEKIVLMMPVIAEGIKRWVIDGTEKAMNWFNAEFRLEAENDGDDELIGSADYENTPIDVDSEDQI
jgi:peptidyl-tRNA hydrolase, PTH1 family